MSSRSSVHFLSGILLTLFVCYLQSVYLARVPLRWLQPDLISIIIIYFAVEHFFFSALGKILAAGFFMELTSVAPSGFYIMFGLIVLVLAHFFAKQVVLHQRLGQLVLFAFLFFLKYVFLGFSLKEKFFLDEFLQATIPSFLTTLLAVIPLFWLLSWFDERFFLKSSLNDPKLEISE